VNKVRIGFLSLALFMILAGVVFAQDGAPDSSTVQLVEAASGFERPLYLMNAGDSTGRLFVVEQGGKIWLVENGQKSGEPFLDISMLLSRDVFNGGYSERGLLGLAFAPDYESSGVFYINYTDVNGNTVVAQYHVSADDPNHADANSAQILLTQEQPYPNHNGGHMVFGPDGYLYIGFGDGGSAGDPEDRAQDTSTLLGKLIRIAVAGDGSYSIPADNPVSQNSSWLPEIWDYGFRNPWRFSFDAQTGDLYVGDVGQNAWEEVNFEPADSPGGLNYGWDAFEGTHSYEGSVDGSQTVMPIAEYSHGFGISVTGGYVYRGAELPQLQGYYIFGDFGTGFTWAAWRDASGTWQSDRFIDTGHTISSFGIDEQNELYLVDYGGSVYRFAAA
jgi:glucose/arabinose dehydrogenase